MQVNISGHHIEVTSALKDYVMQKLKRLERHFDKITNVQVILSVTKNNHQAEAELHVAGANVVANAHHDDMYAAIDLMSDKLDRQLVKHKEKITDHHRGSDHHRGLVPGE